MSTPKGDTFFSGPATLGALRSQEPSPSSKKDEIHGTSAPGLVREVATEPVAWGLATRPIDTRRFRYDVDRARSTAKLEFTVDKADRLSAEEAGNMLHRIHSAYCINAASDARIYAFDSALWFEHTVNGASVLKAGEGFLTVDGVKFPLKIAVDALGPAQRRFFRAFADDIADTNRRVLSEEDPSDPVTVERAGWLRQVAAERGLHKHPHLAHDSADACLFLSPEERSAVLNSKQAIISTTRNRADLPFQRVGESLE
jgi:hypothetical protein